MAFILFIAALLTSRTLAIDLDLTSTDSIRGAARTAAFGLQSIYNGNQTGGVLGKFPFPPYYWWESGAAWGGMVNYWHFTGDSTWNDVTYNAMVSQISQYNDFMMPSEHFDLVSRLLRGFTSSNSHLLG